MDEGPLTEFKFVSANVFFLFSASTTAFVPSNTYQISNLTAAEPLLDGTLSITATAPAAAVTPEPSSLLLLGTGALSLAATARRRFLRS